MKMHSVITSKSIFHRCCAHFACFPSTCISKLMKLKGWTYKIATTVPQTLQLLQAGGFPKYIQINAQQFLIIPDKIRKVTRYEIVNCN